MKQILDQHLKMVSGKIRDYGPIIWHFIDKDIFQHGRGTYHKGPIEDGVCSIESDLRVCDLAIVVTAAVYHDVTQVSCVAVTATDQRS